MNLLSYYKRPEVLEELLRASKNREVCFTLPDGGYTARPGVIQYKNDILEMVKRGCTSIHGSVERWSNPMQIRTGMPQEELNALRMGWDLIIDIDSSLGLEAAKLAAKRVLEFFRKYRLESSIKFSGRRGFHLAIPFESFPPMADFRQTKDMFPHYPRAMAAFLREQIKEDLLRDLAALKGGMSKLFEDDTVGEASPYAFVEIEKDWGSRHLFRLPFSINEKGGFVSVPIKDIDSFETEMAKPENVIVEKTFLGKAGDASDLLQDALNWHAASTPTEEPKAKKEFKNTGWKVPEESFPPCMKNIFAGLRDGRKRSLFIALNYLRSANWEFEEIENRVLEWNTKNSPPLPMAYIRGQLSYASRSKPFLPPNCEKIKAFEFGICTPDQRCARIKNPAGYALRPKPANLAPQSKKTRRKIRIDYD